MATRSRRPDPDVPLLDRGQPRFAGFRGGWSEILEIGATCAPRPHSDRARAVPRSAAPSLRHREGVRRSFRGRLLQGEPERVGHRGDYEADAPRRLRCDTQRMAGPRTSSLRRRAPAFVFVALAACGGRVSGTNPGAASGRNSGLSSGAASAGTAVGSLVATTGSASASVLATTGSAASGDGPCRMVQPSNYDQSCAADTDCVFVREGFNACSPYCPCGASAVVNVRAQAHYSADLSQALAGATPSMCICPARPPSTLVPSCQNGMCALAPWAQDAAAAVVPDASVASDAGPATQRPPAAVVLQRAMV